MSGDRKGYSDNKKTIFVIDDEEVIRNLMRDILDMLGYNVIMSAKPSEALEIYRMHRKHIDLILMDMIMPEMNGQQLYRAMNTIDPDNRVIVLSGYSLVEEVEEMLRDGVIGFIQKPVTINRLKEVIANAFGDVEEQNE